MKHTQIREGSFSYIPLNLPSSLLSACRGAVPCPHCQLVLPSLVAASGVRRSWACSRSGQSCPCLHSAHGLTEDTARAVPPLTARHTPTKLTAQAQLTTALPCQQPAQQNLNTQLNNLPQTGTPNVLTNCWGSSEHCPTTWGYCRMYGCTSQIYFGITQNFVKH